MISNNFVVSFTFGDKELQQILISILVDRLNSVELENYSGNAGVSNNKSDMSKYIIGE